MFGLRVFAYNRISNLSQLPLGWLVPGASLLDAPFFMALILVTLVIQASFDEQHS